MAVPMPPWLDVKPSDFAAAAEAGGRLGLERAGQSIQLTDIATNAALKQAQLQQQSQEASLRAASEAQAHDLEGHRLAVEAAQQQAELGLKQQEVKEEAMQAAQKFQAQQQYQSLVEGGMDPVDAALRVGPGLIGESVGGLGALKRADQSSAFVPSEITTPSGVNMIQHAPGQWSQARMPADWKQTTDADGNPVQQNVVTGEVKAIPGSTKAMTDVQKSNELAKWNTQRDKFMSDNDRYAEMLDAGDPADPSWTKEQKAHYNTLKKQLKGIDDQIDKFGGSSGDSTGGDGSTTSSGLKYSIVPAQ